MSAARLHAALEAAGIPIAGVSIGPPIRIDFASIASDANKQQAAAIVASFDATPRKPRNLAAIMTQIRGLSAAQRTELGNLAMAVLIQNYPRIATRFGVSIEGDSVDGQ